MQMFDRARRFLVEELWKADFGPQSWMNSLVGGLQLGAMIVRGFVDDQLLLRASALTYISSLAIIPVLVVLLSVIQWLGLSRDLVVLVVNQFLAGSPDSVDKIMGFVEHADVGALGSAGGAVFLATTILSLRHVEDTFNDIWGALRGRSWFRRFANYLTVLVMVPLVLGLLVSFSSDLGDGALADQLNAVPMVDVVKSFLLGTGPLVFLFLSFSLVYFLLPNTRVSILSAAIGGLIAAVLFSLAQYGYVSFSVGVARYNSLFGGFAIVPLLLVWMYVSWSIVLFGAEIAYAHQNLASFRREARDAEMEPAEREAVGIRVVVEVARGFRDAWPPQTADGLAVRLGSSLRIVTELLTRFEAAGLVSLSHGQDSETTYQLGRPAETIALGEVFSAIRGTPLDTPAAREADPAVRETVREVEAVLSEVEVALRPVRGRTLGDLLQRLPRQPVS
jgi:membrane protein